MKTLLIILLLTLTGCASDYIQIEKPDGTVYIADITSTMKDRKAAKITVTVNPLTGEHTLIIDRLSSETSPIAQVFGQALLEAYKAGRAGL